MDSHGRLTRPLVREDGELRPTNWEAALAVVAQRFAEIKGRFGPDSFGCYSCSKTTNELNFLAQKFTRAVIGTNNVDSCNRT